MEQKRLLSFLLAIIMIIAMLPATVFAAEYTDTQGHWGESSIDRWSGYSVVEGKGNGMFDPDGLMTRAEAAQVITNLLKLTGKADLSDFTDVGLGKWYDDAIAKCVNAKIMEGCGNGIMDPNGAITREMFFVMFCRALGIKPVDTAEKSISDASKVSNYAKGYITALVNKGYIQGTSSSGDGIVVEPKLNINRASVMSLMDQTIDTYVNTTGKVNAGDGLTLIVVDNANVTFASSAKNAEIYVLGKNTTITNAPVGAKVITSKDATSTRVNGKLFSKDATTVVEKTTPSGGGSYTPPAPAKTFKAVYDQTDGANTLTFYYDSSSHGADGETIILYNNLPTQAAAPEDWGYDGKRDDIETVIFDESLKDYEGLKSTAFMLYEMWDAQGISGAENIVTKNVTNMSYMFYDFGMDNNNIASVPAVGAWDTSKVTNMSNMFKGYGQGSSKINGTPDVSNWNTENVTDMSNMFDSYCQKTTAVPDVSQWDTGNVKDMSYMFSRYGNQSQTLNTVPDVSSWNTENVITMSGMFMNFGNASETLSTVPAVGSWNTENVADMKDMFKYYGPYESSGSRVTFGVLNIVPDVSNWDTGNVADMSSLFYGYGYCSDVLNVVPDVSNWNTENVVNISGLFCAYGQNSSALNAVPDISDWDTGNIENINSIFSDYGYYSTNLIFNVDLSSWDITNITDCDFSFSSAGSNATSWVVTIPAITILTSGEAIENAPGKWYLSDGTKGITPDTSKSRTFNLNINEGDTLYYIYSQNFVVSNTLKYTYASGAYSLTDLIAIPLVLTKFNDGDWVHSVGSGKYVKCTNNHGITLPTLHAITLAGNNVTCVNGLTPLKVPEGTTYKVENGYLSLTYNGNVINSGAAIITPNIGYEVITQSGVIATDTNITIEAKCVNTDSLYYITSANNDGSGGKEYTAEIYEWDESELAFVYKRIGPSFTDQNIAQGLYYHFNTNTGIFTPCTDAITTHAIINPASYTMLPKDSWFTTLAYGTGVNKASIASIVFCSSTSSILGSVVTKKAIAVNESEEVNGYIVNDAGIYKIYIVGDYIFGNEDCSQMFYQFSNLTSIDFGNFNTSNVTNMYAMFASCSQLTALDLSNFNTSNVTTMQAIFASCSQLTALDLSNFNTLNVRNMTYMFNGCSSLTALTLSGIDTSNVTDMANMFNGCSQLTALDLSNLTTSGVTNMAAMFDSCSQLTALDLSNFNTSNVANMANMFSGCSQLTALDLSNFNISQVTKTRYMFNACSTLTSLDLSKFNTLRSDADNADMFKGCSQLKSIKIDGGNSNIASALENAGTGTWSFDGVYYTRQAE